MSRILLILAQMIFVFSQKVPDDEKNCDKQINFVISNLAPQTQSYYDYGPPVPRTGGYSDYDGIWESNQDDVIPINLNRKYLVTGIKTQGDSWRMQYLKSFQVEYSEDCQDFHPIKYKNGTVITFKGNADTSTAVKHWFPDVIETECLRIKALKSYKPEPASRIEVFGCERIICEAERLHITMNTICPDSCFNGSRPLGNDTAAPYARLYNGSSFQPKNSRGSYLQINFPADKILTAIIMRGTSDRFVRSYYLQYGLDCNHMQYLLESKGSRYKRIFRGTSKHVHQTTTLLKDPIRAKCVKFLPIEWGPGGVSMRVDFFGCGTGQPSKK